VPPPASARPAQHRRWLLPSIAVAVAAVVVLAVLFGSLAITRTSSAAIPTYPTFLQASSAAGPKANALADGPWSPVVAAGLRSGVGFSVAPSEFSNGTLTNCTVQFLVPETVPITVNATPVGIPAGAAAFWLIVFSNASGQYAAVAVSGGDATPLFETSGSACTGSSGETVDAFPSNAVDTPAIVAAANASGGAAFLTTNPNASQFWVGVGGVTEGALGLQTVWGVVDTTCPLLSTSNTSGALFVAEVAGAATATVLTKNTSTVTCPTIDSLGMTLALGGPTSGATDASSPYSLSNPGWEASVRE
jgi:hypothetical protein